MNDDVKGSKKGQFGKTKIVLDPNKGDDSPNWGTARLTSHLVLYLRDTDARFAFEAKTIDHLTIGRRDPLTGESPEVDLELYGGLDKGVSRRHASVIRSDGSLNIVDNGSPNGTYLNGQKLVAQQARIVRDGDDIRLGHMVLRVAFETVQTIEA